MSAFACVCALAALPSQAAAKANSPTQVKLCHGVPAGGKNGQSCNVKTGGGKGGLPTPADLAKTVAEMAGKEIGKEIAGFAFNEAGLGGLLDPTSARLAELESQLKVISEQITTLQNSIDSVNEELRQLDLDTVTQPVSTDVSRIHNLYDTYFHVTLTALTKYAGEVHALAKGEVCDPPVPPGTEQTPCGKAKQTFEKRLGEFLAQEANSDNSGLNRDLHERLLGLTGSRPVLNVYGDFVMNGPGSTGLLTPADSDKFRAFHRFFANWEAVGTWMKAEAQGVRFQGDKDAATEFAEVMNPEIFDYPKLENDALPDRIPDRAVISLPVSSTARHGTPNQPMWIWDPAVGANLKWDPVAGATPGPSVNNALHTFDTTAAGLGFADWTVPAKADWDKLLTGRAALFPKPPSDARAFLLDLFGYAPGAAAAMDASFTSNPFVWTSTGAGTIPSSASPGVKCQYYDAIAQGYGTRAIITDYAHTGLPISAPLTTYPTGYPVTNIPSLGGLNSIITKASSSASQVSDCRAQLANLVTKAFAVPAKNGATPGGTFIALRTNTVDFMHLKHP